MRCMVAFLALAGLLVVANGAALAPGLYSLKNVGYKSCDQESVYLGFNNKTCPIAPYSRPASIGTNSVWKSWDITITGYHSSGFPLAYVSTGLPEGKTMRCPGNLSPLEPGTCGKSAVIIDGAKSEWRLVGPVSGYTNPTYKLVANMKKSGCARYLSASSSCEDSSLKMATSGDSSRTLWELTPLQLGTKAPGAATIVTVTRGSGAERTTGDVSFVAPEDPGCGPILHYDITAKPVSGSGATITKEVSGSRTSTKLEGMTSNIRYNVTISATNACGEGPTTWYVETLASSDAVASAGFTSACAVKADSKLACVNEEIFAFADVTAVPRKWTQYNDVVMMTQNVIYGSALARNGTLGVWGANVQAGCPLVDGPLNFLLDAESLGGPTGTIPMDTNPYGDNDIPAGDASYICLPEAFESDVAHVHGWFGNLCITKKNGDMACIGIDFSRLTGAAQDDFDGCTPIDNGMAADTWDCSGDWEDSIDGLGVRGDWIDFSDLPGYTRFGSGGALYDGYLKGVKLAKISVDVGCAVYLNGNLRCWGSDWLTSSAVAALPLPISYYNDIIDVGVSVGGVCAVKSNGDMACSRNEMFFFGGYGIDGSGDENSVPFPGYTGKFFTTPIPEGFDRDIASVDCALSGCCALKNNGDFTCWGDTTNVGEDSFSSADSAPMGRKLKVVEGSTPGSYLEAYIFALTNVGLGTIPNWIAGINKYTWRTFTAEDWYDFCSNEGRDCRNLDNDNGGWYPPYASARRLTQTSSGSSIRWPVVTDVVSFSMGIAINCIIRKDGSLQCWGLVSQDNGAVFNDAIQVQLTLSGYDYLF